MSKYLLNCPCGKQIRVDVGQAGGQVTCSCGTQLDVPALRNLRHLPTAEPDSTPTSTPWNARKGVTAAALIIAFLLASYAGWNYLTEPTVPKFDPAYRSSAVDDGLEKMTPADAWHLWVERYRPLAKSGFDVYEHPHKAAIEAHLAQRRVLQSTLLVIAAVAAAIALVAAFWPKPTAVPARMKS